jgi:BirA family biotin operon repressor/biotin-[acetyl-CoA-carboxylase] ligase
MIVDDVASLLAVGGRCKAGPFAGRPPAPGTFAAQLWTACATGVPGLRVPIGDAGDLGSLSDAAGGRWHEVLVGAAGRVSPYEALREVTATGCGLPGPVACLTLGGAALRGQHGRRWHAAPGNLHLSVAVPCDLDAATCGPSLPMLAAVAACEAVERLLGHAAAASRGLSVKWVNDIVIDDGKTGGVLTALRTRGPRITEYFAGLALNLAAAPALPPDPFALPATALAVSGPAPALGPAAAAVMERLLDHLEQVADRGAEALVEAYRARSLVLGREVAVWEAGIRERLAAGEGTGRLPPPARRGRVVSIGADLALALAGQDEPVRDGCLRLVAPHRPGPEPA